MTRIESEGEHGAFLVVICLPHPLFIKFALFYYQSKLSLTKGAQFR